MKENVSFVLLIILGVSPSDATNLITQEGLTLVAPKMKKVEIANRVDPDEVAQNESPHLDLHCLLFTL